MFPQLLQHHNAGLFVLRLAVAIIFIFHALPKLKNAKAMAQGIGAPTGVILLLGTVELLSSLGLIFGIYTQVAALLLAIIMIGAIKMKAMKWHVPFIGTTNTGWEFDFILLAANIAILLTGGGSIGIL